MGVGGVSSPPRSHPGPGQPSAPTLSGRPQPGEAVLQTRAPRPSPRQAGSQDGCQGSRTCTQPWAIPAWPHHHTPPAQPEGSPALLHSQCTALSDIIKIAVYSQRTWSSQMPEGRVHGRNSGGQRKSTRNCKNPQFPDSELISGAISRLPSSSGNTPLSVCLSIFTFVCFHNETGPGHPGGAVY